MTKSEPQVTAVIVTYQSKDTVAHALNALYEAYGVGYLECVVVDNNSNDGTSDLVTENFPWVNLIRSNNNLGYGRGCNLGLMKVSTPYVLILNPDAEISFKALQTLVNFMVANRQVGIAAPAIVEGENSLQAAGLMTTPSSLLKAAFGFRRAMPQNQPITPDGSPFKTNWICGAIMLIRTDLFRKLGGFDPRFFLYFEETDFCRRATQYGAEIWAVGGAVTKHIGGVSAKSTGQSLESSCIAEHFYTSRFYYLVKHFGWVRAIGTELIVRIVRYLRYLRHGLLGRQQSSQTVQGKRPFLRFPSKPGDFS